MEAPRICVLIPVFNHGLTVGQVVRGAQAAFPTIAVNDGSTDQTASVLAAAGELTVVTLPRNEGKGAALRAGFDRASALGFTHAIAMDADGQHATAALPDFAAACRRQPEALIVGVRDLRRDGAPAGRRASNRLSNFGFRFATGVALADTQCGYRCYPLAAITKLPVRAERYGYELEVMVKAAWAGLPLVPLAIQADYAAPTSRLSHFRPWRDMARLSWLHSRLAMQAFFVPAALRRLSVQGHLRNRPWRQRVRIVARHLFSENAGTPGRLAGAVGLGMFCGVAPIWGLQMLAAALLAHKLRLNKAVALAASNISFAPVAPLIMAAGLVLGHYLWTGGMVNFAPGVVMKQIPLYFWEWFLGSVLLAIAAGAVGFGVAYLAGLILLKGQGTPRR